MSTFAQTYTPAVPVSTDLVSNTDTYFREFKVSVQERVALEHYDFVSGSGTKEAVTAQGRHKPGYVQAVFVGTSAQIAALTGMTLGCLAYDTTLGALLIYGTTWSTYQIGSVSIFQMTKTTGNLTFSPGATIKVTFNNIPIPGTGADLVNSQFVVPVTGNYLFTFCTSFPGTINKTSCGVAVGGTPTGASAMAYTLDGSNISVANGTSILPLTAGNVITMWARYETPLTIGITAYFSGYKIG
jgi:hypothetical protein